MILLRCSAWTPSLTNQNVAFIMRDYLAINSIKHLDGQI